jgi:2-dehydro-3-deoxygalactonokinase
MLKFLSCDWGTSSFRLRLVNTADKSVTHEHFSDFGIKEAYKAWNDANTLQDQDRQQFYLNHIREAVKALEGISGEDLDGWMIICSGMVSSSVGIKELPYASVPFPTSGQGMEMHLFSPSATLNHPLIIFSGLKTNHNVMRGEETQLIGLITQLPDFKGEGIFIFPGTHSKHIFTDSGKISDFNTFMTGEVFKLLGQHSLLSNSIEENFDRDRSTHTSAFEKGVMDGSNKALLSVLFNVRTNDLFGHFDKKENYHYLSGLLIGNELWYLASIIQIILFICAPKKNFINLIPPH